MRIDKVYIKEFKKSLTQKDKDYIIGLTEDDTPTIFWQSCKSRRC